MADPIKIYEIQPTSYQKIVQVTRQDHFARNGYTLRDAKALGIDRDVYYLYIKAPEEFFKEHEKEILIEGVKPLESVEYENVKRVIEAEEENVASGIALFG
ncbi:MAG: hypothetical protein J7K68_00980 [Candidatus Diapherotrites archaeon]|nr:hypothetical protein [Candidatus Diapherotrites archaeon]